MTKQDYSPPPPTPSACPDDAALVRAAQAHDEDAFARLINRYRNVVLRQMRAQLWNRDDAEDATQETFVAAYRHLRDLQEGRKFAGWLRAIAARVALKWRHKRLVECARCQPLDSTLMSALTTGGPEEKPNRLPFLREAIAALPPECRVVVTLFYLIRLEQREIAHLLGVPVGTVKSRLHRSKTLLHRRIENMTDTPPSTPPAEDYGRAVIAGMRGVIHWQSLLPDNDLRPWRGGIEPDHAAPPAGWSRQGSALLGEDKGGTASRLFTGDSTWADFELSLLITPLSGGNAQVQFRVSESGQQFYLLDLLLGWQAIALSRVDVSQEVPIQKLSVVNFPLAAGHEYDVLLAARGASLTTYVDGALVNQVTDFAYRSGPAALNVWESKTAYRDPRVRLLA